MLLGREAERLAGEAAAARAQVERVEQVLRRVQQAQALGDSTSLDVLRDIYSSLHRDFPEEYVMHNLAAVALMQVRCRLVGNPHRKQSLKHRIVSEVQWAPILFRYCRGWQPSWRELRRSQTLPRV